MSKHLLSTGSFLFPQLAEMEEQNSSNARRRATGDEGTFLKQSTLLCCFSPTLFKAAIYVDGQNLVDVMKMILYPKMLGF